MSQPRRYLGIVRVHPPKDGVYRVEHIKSEYGSWVSYDDYADLAAENERLRQHLEFFRGKFDAKSNKLLARILKDTKKFAAKEGVAK